MINSKPLIVMKLKNSNCGETQKIKWGEMEMKLKNPNCDETKKLKL